MNPIIILLGILIIIILYLLYCYLFPSKTIIANQALLNQQNPPITNFPNPAGSRYALGIWLYVNSFANPGENIIYSRNDNAGITLAIDPSPGPTLHFDINSYSGTQRVTITDNYPIQKWVCILISVDNQFVDAYLDGKLVVSSKLPEQPNASSSDTSTYPINLGNNVDATVTLFTEWATPVNPQQAYDYYSAGNGTSFLSSRYGANLNILKDNVLSSRITLF